MGKKKRKARYEVPVKNAFIESETSSLPQIHPNATLAPGEASESTADSNWLSSDSTNAPLLGEDDRKDGEYVESYAGLVDKHVLSKGGSIPFILAIGVIGYIFIQDNGAGTLKDWDGLLWTLKKSGIIFGCFLGAQILQRIYKWIIDKRCKK